MARRKQEKEEVKEEVVQDAKEEKTEEKKDKILKFCAARKDRIAELESQGFNKVGDGKDDHGRVDGVRTHSEDLVLMEK